MQGQIKKVYIKNYQIFGTNYFNVYDANSGVRYSVSLNDNKPEKKQEMFNCIGQKVDVKMTEPDMFGHRYIELVKKG